MDEQDFQCFLSCNPDRCFFISWAVTMKKNKGNRVLAVTLGDVNGIGPEVALKAALGRGMPRDLAIVLTGAMQVIRAECRRMKLAQLECWEPGRPLRPGSVVAWDPVPDQSPLVHYGKTSAEAASAAAAWILAAAKGSLQGVFDGMVTAPISKEGLEKAGIKYPGHTEMIADAAGVDKYAMMLTGGNIRVVLATRHIPLSSVPRALTRASVVLAGEMAGKALPWLGMRSGRIAVCGLNPHAGDGGVLGTEEQAVIVPAIRDLRRKGFSIEGPLAGDAVFHKAAKGEYGAVVAMYHDQGLGPLKTVAFDTGVNLTLGLPFVRTSPDHGVAFDIAGKNRAKASSMISAVNMAYELAGRRNPWRG